MSLKHFIQITKPGIIFDGVLSVANGFFLASRDMSIWPSSWLQ